jgi:hypothetical protein
LLANLDKSLLNAHEEKENELRERKGDKRGKGWGKEPIPTTAK